MDITHLRKNYTKYGLSRNDLEKTPLLQFNKWFTQAQEAGIEEPNAMSIATVSESGVPSSRTVLLKIYDENGFVFFTNYTSQKAIEMDNNPNVAILFQWLGLERQIRVTGKAEKISKRESFAYFRTRPKGSQLGAWISPQSKIIESRDFLKMKLAQIKDKFSHGEIPLPDAWGGYRVIPERFEFWQGRSSRLHDRFVYVRNQQGENFWDIHRLAP